MDMLIQWITQIVVFLLLASIIDLLIPTNTIKKYIKLVVGLILILIFLKPVFYLFNFDIERELDQANFELYGNDEKADSVDNLIKIQKKDIQASNDAYILEEMSYELKKLAKEPLLDGYNVKIIDINFLFAQQGHISYENLEEIVVYLHEFNEEEGVVNIVEEIIINSEDQETDYDIDNMKQIKETLQEIWEVGEKQLTLKWEGGAP